MDFLPGAQLASGSAPALHCTKQLCTTHALLVITCKTVEYALPSKKSSTAN